jgi:hypothetical protein
VPLEDAECNDWDLVGAEPWPEQAYYDMTPDDARDTCTLAAWRPFDTGIGGRVNALCGSSTLPVAHLHPRFRFEDQCTTRIAGGGIHGGYRLELRDRAGNTHGDVVAGCDVDLLVLGVAGTGAPDVRLPSVWVLVVQQKGDGSDTTVLPVEIRVAYADATTSFACGPGPAFHCD